MAVQCSVCVFSLQRCSLLLFVHSTRDVQAEREIGLCTERQVELAVQDQQTLSQLHTSNATLMEAKGAAVAELQSLTFHLVHLHQVQQNSAVACP